MIQNFIKFRISHTVTAILVQTITNGNAMRFIANNKISQICCIAIVGLKKGKINECIVGYILSSLQSHNALNLWYFGICDKPYGMVTSCATAYSSAWHFFSILNWEIYVQSLDLQLFNSWILNEATLQWPTVYNSDSLGIEPGAKLKIHRQIRHD